jgi:recombinational DNA repair ATPase RecF
MDDVLLGIVLDRLGHQQLAEEPTDLLLAAMEGDDALASQLSAAPGERHSRPNTAASAQDPVGAYLSSVTVTGFRGIGSATTLAVKSGPGLTLVVGRNGSGKSSFAEGLEVLLTGDLMRWKAAPSVVREGWRCKHTVEEPTVTAEFYVEGKGKTTVNRSWPSAAGTDAAHSSAWVQVQGEKQEPIQALGWDASLVGYRPFLSHAELEAFFGKPSELYDLLANVLGLEDLTAADKRLQTAAKQRDDKLSEVKNELKHLRVRLAALAEQDERAAACMELLPGTSPAMWDIDAALAVTTGSHHQLGNEGQIGRLRSLANLTAPSSDDVAEAVKRLQEAATRMTNLTGSAAEQARDLAALLDAALGHHQAHGDGPCPVCGNAGALTAAWHTATEQHRDRLRQDARAADEAADSAKTAMEQAQSLIHSLPQPLTTENADDPSATASAAEAWRRWTAVPKTPGPGTTTEKLIALAGHLESAHGPLAAAIATLSDQATSELASRDDRWSPLAGELAAWCETAAHARSGALSSAPLKAARQWLTKATAELRHERLAPLADQSRSIWADLRQESNVDLGEFRLTGTNTRRQLDLDVTIDGESGAALGVMSQGEINALALSIFLPRATIPASPFRFLIIDDPVQAMDPAKVDGLAKVLSKVAEHRQVIVFTHDNRLTAAIRDLSIPATFLEVTRQPRSKVSVRECLDASKQALQDAHSLSKDPSIPAKVAERVIPGLCRTAAEAAFLDAYWRTELRRGRTRSEIEESLEGDGKKLNLRTVAALALFGNVKDTNNAKEQLAKQWGHTFARTYGALNKGAHEGHSGSLANLIDDTKALVSKITEKLP